jgi:hypothetical protein
VGVTVRLSVYKMDEMCCRLAGRLAEHVMYLWQSMQFA